VRFVDKIITEWKIYVVEEDDWHCGENFITIKNIPNEDGVKVWIPNCRILEIIENFDKVK
jgi:hypothetical protein